MYSICVEMFPQYYMRTRDKKKKEGNDAFIKIRNETC